MSCGRRNAGASSRHRRVIAARSRARPCHGWRQAHASRRAAEAQAGEEAKEFRARPTGAPRSDDTPASRWVRLEASCVGVPSFPLLSSVADWNRGRR